MTKDPLDQLGMALKRHTPPASDAGREAALHAAMENFSTELQGSTQEARHTSDQPQKGAGFWTGVTTMLIRLTSPRALMGTTALASCAFALLVIQNMGNVDLGDASYAPPDPEDTVVRADMPELLAQSDAPAPRQATPSLEMPADAPAAPSAEQERAPQEATPASAAFETLAIEAGARDGIAQFLQPEDLIDLFWTGEVNGQTVKIEIALNLEVVSISPPLDDAPEHVKMQLELKVPLQILAYVKEKASNGQLSVALRGSWAEAIMGPLEVTESDLSRINNDEQRAYRIERRGLQITRLEVPGEELLRQREGEEQAKQSDGPPSSASDEMTAAAPQTPGEYRSDPNVTFGATGQSTDGIAFEEALKVDADDVARPEADTEAYPQAEANSIKRVADEPVSTFSIDVDTASYGVVRSSLQAGHLPPKGAVRIEELVNYFDYAYPRPDSAEAPFATSVSVAPTPWNPDTQLMHIGIQGYADIERPPLNLVFLIDSSGSMESANKLPLLRASFKLLVESLNPQDSIAIVTYAGSAGMALEPTPASDQSTILAALDRLSAGGSTAGQAGLQQAYGLAEQMAEEGEISRVILATDGDFNVGISDPGALKGFIADKRETGTYLSVLGFGRGNYDDATMQALAQNGNGTAAYIDTLAEAQKVLVEDMTANLFPIAGDVKIQVEFNPAQISEYRLIGYETRALNREDFNNDAVDAGEIGAGHTVTAIYEITPKGSPAEQFGELRYAEAAAAEEAAAGAELAFLKLRYKHPGETRSTLIETPITADRADIPAEETAFATAVAAFGQQLRGNTRLGDWSYRDTLALASRGRGEDPFGYRAEFMSLVRLADAID